MIIINKSLTENITKQAKISQRKRMNYNFHANYDDSINRMLNAIEPNSYVRPHKHENPDKREVFIILTGKLLVVIFNDNGEVINKVILSHASGCFGVEIPPATWHSIVALETGTIIYEIKDGPYVPLTDKDFATWAPTEEDENLAKEFMDNLIFHCGNI